MRRAPVVRAASGHAAAAPPSSVNEVDQSHVGHGVRVRLPELALP